VAPIVSEARTLGQFLAPAHRRLSALASNLWWELGRGDDQPVPRSRPAAVARARAQPDRPAAAVHHRAAGIAGLELACTAGSTTAPAHAGALASKTWGVRHAGVLWARPSRISSPSSACTGRCRSHRAASDPPGDHIKALPIWAALVRRRTLAEEGSFGSGSIATATSRRMPRRRQDGVGRRSARRRPTGNRCE
jgi:hypothetical protein